MELGRRRLTDKVRDRENTPCSPGHFRLAGTAGVLDHSTVMHNPQQGGQVSAEPWDSFSQSIYLTPANSQFGPKQDHVSVPIGQLIAYSKDGQYTRLSITGRKVLLVEEPTDRIDQLVRAASNQTKPLTAVILRV
jgi:hypothetical protein